MLSRDEQLKNNCGTICTLVEMKAISILKQNNYEQHKII